MGSFDPCPHRGERFVCVLVPIEACYQPVGIVRRFWTGFQGGPQVWSRIDAFSDGLLKP